MPASRFVLTAALAVALLAACSSPVPDDWDVDIALGGQPAEDAATGWVIDGGGVGPIRFGDTWAQAGEHLTDFDDSDPDGCGSAWGTGPDGESVSVWGEPIGIIVVSTAGTSLSESPITLAGFGLILGIDPSGLSPLGAVEDMEEMWVFEHDGIDFTAFERDGVIATVVAGASGFLGC